MRIRLAAEEREKVLKHEFTERLVTSAVGNGQVNYRHAHGVALGISRELRGGSDLGVSSLSQHSRPVEASDRI